MHHTRLSLTLAPLLLTLTATLNILPTLTNISTSRTTSSTLSHLPRPSAAHIPIPLAAGLSLTITHLGAPIPPEEAAAYLHNGIESLRRVLHTNHADDPLRHDRWVFGGLPDFEIAIGGTVSYAQLSFVVQGVQRFMLQSESSRDLQFHVQIEGKGKVASGVVRHELLSAATAKEDDVDNATPPTSAVPPELLHLPTTNLSSTPPPPSHSATVTMPRACTRWSLVVDWFGAPMPPTLFYKSYVAARLEVRQHSPTEALPGGKWAYTQGGADIEVAWNTGGGLTWERLLMVLDCLHSFVTGDPPRYQVLHFEIQEGRWARKGCVGCKGGVVVGSGFLVFHAPKPLGVYSGSGYRNII